MKSKKILISAFFLISIGIGFFLAKKNGEDSNPTKITQKNRKEKRSDRFERNRKNRQARLNKFNKHDGIQKRRERPDRRLSSETIDWAEIGDYQYKNKIIEHFSRFRKRKSASSEEASAPEINLKLGKLVEKKQRDKMFNIREILVTIEDPKRPKNFIAFVDENSGRIIQKQGRRITDPLSKIGNPRQRIERE